MNTRIVNKEIQKRISRIAAVVFLATMGFAFQAQAADDDTLTIAYNVTLPSWDPTVGLSAVNPTIQSSGFKSQVQQKG